jgi:outer membrane protein OmpA-like peptidoglycan-associated protein
VGVASLGYGFGNGWRVELEADGRYNALAHVPLAYESKIGGMANGYFDLDVGSPYIYPYIGAGAGAMDVHRNVSGTPNSGEFAYQGIFGTAFPVAPVVGLSVTLEYRFMGLAGANTTLATPPPLVAHVKFDRDYNHSALLGLRYAFNVVPPAPAAAAPPAAAPAPQAARSYLVFFDWDRADLSDRAKAIISTAAQNSTHVEYTSIAVNGYTDRSGSAAYNQRLSVRRAQAVAAELMRDGVPTKAISIQGFGESNPLVPTAKGVREPQNRRVEIIIQ